MLKNKEKIINELDAELEKLESLIKQAANENEIIKLRIRKKEIILKQLELKEQ